MTAFIYSLTLRIAIALLLTLQPVAAKEQPFSGQVIVVTDGDTIKVLHDGIPEKIRLSGIDCPEKKQAFGASAKKLTSDLCFGKQVTIIPSKLDRYGRTVGRVVLPDGRVLNSELVGRGQAWWYYRYAPSDQDLHLLEISVRVRHLGLWADTNPIAPWEFRHHKVATAY